MVISKMDDYTIYRIDQQNRDKVSDLKYELIQLLRNELKSDNRDADIKKVEQSLQNAIDEERNFKMLHLEHFM